MLLLACEKGCVDEAMIMSAMLSVERVFYSYVSSRRFTVGRPISPTPSRSVNSASCPSWATTSPT